MGRVFDRFGNLTFQNEAEVSQNFLVPLLMEFLGYKGGGATAGASCTSLRHPTKPETLYQIHISACNR